MNENAKYFNFPVQLLSGFLDNKLDVLNNIFDYSVYARSITLEGDAETAIKAACKFFGVTTGNHCNTRKNGETLHDSVRQGSPMVGINIEMFFDYYTNHKSEFEDVCLLAFLALKSIIQNKPYCKVTNSYLLSRMDGNAQSFQDENILAESLRKYASRRMLDKIKKELQFNWNVNYYSFYTRGFYVSIDNKLELEKLVFEAEKRRKSTKEKELKQRIISARSIAIEQLNINHQSNYHEN